MAVWVGHSVLQPVARTVQARAREHLLKAIMHALGTLRHMLWRLFHFLGTAPCCHPGSLGSWDLGPSYQPCFAPIAQPRHPVPDHTRSGRCRAICCVPPLARYCMRANTLSH